MIAKSRALGSRFHSQQSNYHGLCAIYVANVSWRTPGEDGQPMSSVRPTFSKCLACFLGMLTSIRSFYPSPTFFNICRGLVTAAIYKNGNVMEPIYMEWGFENFLGQLTARQQVLRKGYMNLMAYETSAQFCKYVDLSKHVDLSASGYIFGLTFGRYPTIHTLTSVGRNSAFNMPKECFHFFVLQ